MIFSYPTEIRGEKEFTFEIGNVTLVKADGLSETLIPILRQNCVLWPCAHSKMVD